MTRVLPSFAVIGAVAALVVVVWSWKVERDVLSAENASLTRSVAALTLERDQAKEGRAVADAARQLAEDRAAEINTIREKIAKGQDDAIPSWMLDHLRDLDVVQPDSAH
ncbi:MAG: hypothetical protein ABJL99_10190 [Aliishimia sp.]